MPTRQDGFENREKVYLLEQKKALTQEKSSTPTGLVWNTNMAAVALFWDTNMAAVTSCENTLFKLIHIYLVYELKSL